MGVVTTLGKIRSVSSSERWILVHAWYRLGAVRMVLRVRSLEYFFRNLKLHQDEAPSSPVSPAEAKRAVLIGRSVARAARFTPWLSTCLVQALVTQQFLAKEGIAGRFHLGVRFSDKSSEGDFGLFAHAWLECGDQVVNGQSGRRYTRMSSFSW